MDPGGLEDMDTAVLGETLYLRRAADYLLRSLMPELLIRVEAKAPGDLFGPLIKKVAAIEPKISVEKTVDELLERVPDEFYEWIKDKRAGFRDEFDSYHCWAGDMIGEKIQDLGRPFENQKEFALWAKEQAYPSLLFNLWSGKSMNEKIWKMMKPKYEKPFKQIIQ